MGANSDIYSFSPTSNRLAQIVGSTNKTYAYDASGNVTGDGVKTFTYDARGRLLQAIVGAGYQVNSQGQRVIKRGAGAETHFHYDAQGRLIAETGPGGGAPQKEYVYLGDLPVAVLQTQTPAGLYFMHPDHLNTPRTITNQAQQVVWKWDNVDAFGNNAPNQNPSGLGNFTCNLRLPGQYFDSETNLHYNYFRDFDPAIGRYVQSDPIGLKGGMIL